jgi:protein phosphatase 1A
LQSGDYERAIADAVRDEDELLLKAFQQGTEIFAEAGSTLAVCLLNLTRAVLVVGNLGDTHILLGE